jgi:hypothetical protein
LGEQRQATGPERDDEDERPNPFGLFPLLVLVVLVIGGLLLMMKLRDDANTQDCVWSGRKNCAPVEVPTNAPPP